ncbi:hypothetical protein [uncultured Oscillibacter sp.]|uniref:hypothetical protein n=1 Tax=uncultured Oscillibacter sp. TaxID=876091 RepID=UPI00262E9E9E|nr:hypothetical protein [uncultured Oscillibacter sp.]
MALQALGTIVQPTVNKLFRRSFSFFFQFAFYCAFFFDVCDTLLQSKHNHQSEQIRGTKKAVHWSALKLAGCGRPFFFLNAGEFELCVFPKNPKSGGFASPVRYFYFTPPDFSNVRKLFLIALSFLILYAKIPH